MHYIGVDVGGTSVKTGVISSDGKILAKSAFAIRKGNNGLDFIDDLKENLPLLIGKAGVDMAEVKGIGIGIPGAVNTTLGRVDYNGNIGWRFFEIVKETEKAFLKPVKIGNDANVAALGEAKFGSGKNYKNTIMFTLGTGVGGGIIIDGKLLEGNEGKGAEVGHEVIKIGGRKCTCGRRGCFEAYASATGLIKTAKEYMAKNPDSLMWKACGGDEAKVTPITVFDCAKANDKTAEKVVKIYVKYLSEGLLNFCNVFRPEAILLGGGVAEQGDYLLDKVRKYCKDRNFGFKTTPEVAILKAELGADAGIIGAAALLM